MAIRAIGSSSTVSGKPSRAIRRSLSELLGDLRLSGRTWCYADFSARGGCAIAPGDALVVHAVIHGQVRLACAGGTKVELGPGDIAMVLSGEAHALRTAPDARALPHEGLRRADASDIPATLTFGDGGRLDARVLSGRLHATWPGGVSRGSLPSVLRVPTTMLQGDALPLAGLGAGSCALLTRVAEMLLVAALRADAGCRRILSTEARNPIADALQLIAAAPAQDWTVESLARAVGMGRSNFAAHFSQAVGKAPMEVVAEHRMEHAATLLRQGRMKIAEIAELAGYGSEAAFSRRFSRHFGITPSQLRDQARAARSGDEARPHFRALLAGTRNRAAAMAPGDATPDSPSPALPPGRVILARGKRD